MLEIQPQLPKPEVNIQKNEINTNTKQKEKKSTFCNKHATTNAAAEKQMKAAT